MSNVTACPDVDTFMATVQATPNTRHTSIGLADFLSREFPPRKNILAPWLPTQGLSMVYAARGVGKTFFGLSVAYAVASGGEYLGFRAPGSSGVLYMDGEMPASVMQERLAAIVRSSEREADAEFTLMTPDMQPEGMPRLDTEDGQASIDCILTDAHKLIVVDNISTLTATRENEADGWTAVQQWALRMRASGRSVLFIHHAGKGGNQRGTSRREDVLDTVIVLRRPSDYDPKDGAVFEVHFEKSRGIYGDDVTSIEAALVTDDRGDMLWTYRPVEDSTFEKVKKLLDDGLSQKDIAEELKINKSNVSRHAKRARDVGVKF